jgi:hypothetical protein
LCRRFGLTVPEVRDRLHRDIERRELLLLRRECDLADSGFELLELCRNLLTELIKLLIAWTNSFLEYPAYHSFDALL